ncbi:hypothetical protein Q4555_07260 [Octadecabacter sp. 1_MG-2023]|uniref:hypothetical protein n=1 Tax=unclassified Octadecabacter TaxID=196158 RepID=UPI001C09AEE6|nr:MULTISPECIES: hypothetical protein [unclassified Octadecabacter]MBU2994250.1 hypothetical protein [Octadecabacter sp. B2R22]MDO6734461.1 hypothetical protein [Octadecabacter sp. 1_MG-2023]
MKRVTTMALIAATTLGAQPMVGEEVIRLVSHNPPFGFNDELEEALEAYPNLALSKEWYSHSAANLWVFFIADGGSTELGNLPRFAQKIYAEAGSPNPAFLKFVFGDALHGDGGEITIVFFNESFSVSDTFACVSANFVAQIFKDQAISNANAILERCTL